MLANEPGDRVITLSVEVAGQETVTRTVRLAVVAAPERSPR